MPVFSLQLDIKAKIEFPCQRHLVIYFGFIFMAWHPCLAQFSPWRTFSTADGLGDVEVYTIFEPTFDTTAKGHIWFGTKHGATRFDGRWRNFTQTDGLVNNRVLSIAEVDSGILWFGTEKGISIYANNKFSNGPDTLANETIWAITRDDKHAGLWFGTSRGVAFRFDQNKNIWRRYKIGGSVFSNEIRDILVDRSGNVWFGTLEGVWRLDANDQLYKEELIAIIRDIFEDMQGNLWFATDGLGVWRYKPMTKVWERVGMGKFSAKVSSIEQDWDGNYWFATLDGGVVRYDGYAQYERFQPQNGLAGNVVLDVMEDSYRNLWFATMQTGVSRYNGSWRTFKQVSISDEKILSIEQVNTIEIDKERNFWFGLNGGGALHYDREKWQQINGSEFDICADSKISTIKRTRDGTLWFGMRGRGGGISYFDNSQWRKIKSPRDRPEECDSLFYYAYKIPTDTLTDNFINTIYEDQERNLWFATEKGGVSRYNRFTPNLPRWTNFAQNSGLAANSVHAIYEYPKGIFWFGTTKGISRFDGKNWTTFDNERNGFSSESILSIAGDGQGTLWFGTEAGGILIYKGAAWDSLKTEDGLVHNTVYALVYDARKGVLWCGTHGGVTRVAGDEKRTFTTLTSGLPSNIVFAPFLENAINTAKNDTASILWFGTFTGAARYSGEAFPPETFIISSINDTIGIGNPTFTVFARDNISHPDAISYRYRILVIRRDETKTEVRPWRRFSENEITVSPALETGVYEIEVQALDSDGNLDPTPATRRFAIDIGQPTVVISAPLPGEHLSGEITIKGRVEDRDFIKYEIDYRQDSRPEWSNGGIIYPSSNSAQVKGPDPGILALWNTPKQCANAVYHLRLRAWDRLGHVDSTEVSVVVDQMAKEVNVDARLGGIVSASCGSKRVEFYIPPNSDIRRVRLISLGSTDVACENQSDSVLIGYRISMINEQSQELYPALEEQGAITIKDPSIVNHYDDEKFPTIFHKIPGSNRSCSSLEGTIDFEQQTISTRFSALGIFILAKAKRAPKPGAADFVCRPRVFSTTNSSMPKQTQILFKLNDSKPVTIWIYNMAGRLIRKLMTEQPFLPGENAISWDGVNDRGDPCVSGLYLIIRLTDGKKQIETVAIVNR